MHVSRLLILSAAIGVALVSARALALDRERVSEIVGVPATVTADGAVRVGWPRTDVALRVDALAFSPQLGLGTWAAFQEIPHGARVMGDTVVFEDEVDAAIDAAFASGI